MINKVININQYFSNMVIIHLDKLDMEVTILISLILIKLKYLVKIMVIWVGSLKVFSFGYCIVHYNPLMKRPFKFNKNLHFLNSQSHSFKPIMIILFSIMLIKPQLPSTLCDMKLFMNSLPHWLLDNLKKVWESSTVRLMTKNLRT